MRAPIAVSGFLLLLHTAAYAQQPTNLIPNPGFEEGAEGWELTRAEVVTADAHSGDRCCYISQPTTTRVDFGKTKFFIVSEVVTVDAQKPYTAQVWWKHRGEAHFWLHAWCYDAEGEYIGDVTEGQIREFVGVDVWHRRRSFVGLPAGAATMRLCLELARGHGEVWFDDIALYPGRIEDPALNETPTFTIARPAKQVHLGRWLQCELANLTVPEGRELIACEWQLPTRKAGKRRPSYGWEERRSGARGEVLSVRPMHVGEFTLGATVMDTLGAQSEPASAEFEVLPNEPPKAEFTGRVREDGTVELDASLSRDPDGEIAQYEWELPDGRSLQGPTTIYEPRPALPGMAPSAVTVTLRVTDNYGLEALREREIALAGAPLRGTERATLADPIRLAIDDEGLRLIAAPATYSLRLGFREYLPIEIRNETGREQTLVAEGRASLPNVSIRGFQALIGEQARLTLEIRSLLFVDSAATLRFRLQERPAVEVPVAIEVTETFPLFGTQEHFTRRPPGLLIAERDMPCLADLPCQVYRLPDTVTGLSDAKRNWGFAEWYMSNLQHLAHTKIAPFMGYVPLETWLELRDGETDTWRKSVETVVARFRGRVDYWMPHNEPPWNDEVKEWYAERGADAMLNMQRVLHEVARELDPTAQVMSPGWSLHASAETVVAELFERGVDQYTDIFCYHDYTCWGRRSLDPANAPEWAEYDAGARTRCDWFLGQMREHGVDKPVWITECGGTAPDDREKAMMWLRAVGQWISMGIDGVLQYELFDYPHDSHPPTFFMMRGADRCPTMFFRAYQELIRALTGATPAGEIALAEDLVGHRFRRGNEDIVLLWSNASEEAEVRVNLGRGDVVELSLTRFSASGPFKAQMRMTPSDPQEHAVTLRLAPLEFVLVSAATVE